MSIKRPNLFWKLKDYKKNGIEAPEELYKNPEKTEGELMGESDIENWILDTIKVFKVIKGEDKKLFEKLYKIFVQDVSYLEELGRLNKDQAENILNNENF